MAPTAEVVLANRAYADHQAPPGAPEAPATGAGGLLAVVQPVIQPWDGSEGTTWIGPGRGPFDSAFVDSRGFEILPTSRGPLRHRRLFFDAATWQGHYPAASNGFLWPLLHLSHRPLPALVPYYPRPEPPSPSEWHAYQRVNQAFAGAAKEEHARTVWVHDYQLGLVPAALREAGFVGRIGFSLHTPFPSLPVARECLDSRGEDLLKKFVSGILGSDLVGLQCAPDVDRFIGLATDLGLAEPCPGGLRIGGRLVQVAPFPVGPDVESVITAARQGQLPDALSGRDPALPLVVGLERADYTKGIPERLGAIAEAYRRGARFTYAGFASPTREGVPAYARLGEAINASAAGAAIEAQRAGCLFLQEHASISWPQVVALLRDADVVFTSSLADGMNLVPLQAAIAQSARPAGQRGTIICGRDTGVTAAFADCLGQGLEAVDPLDQAAMVALLTSAVERRSPRVTDAFIERVRRRDAHHWATGYLNALMGQPA